MTKALARSRMAMPGDGGMAGDRCSVSESVASSSFYGQRREHYMLGGFAQSLMRGRVADGRMLLPRCAWRDQQQRRRRRRTKTLRNRKSCKASSACSTLVVMARSRGALTRRLRLAGCPDHSLLQVLRRAPRPRAPPALPAGPARAPPPRRRRALVRASVVEPSAERSLTQPCSTRSRASALHAHPELRRRPDGRPRLHGHAGRVVLPFPSALV